MYLSDESCKKIQICRAIAILGVVTIHNCPPKVFCVSIRLLVNFCVALFIFLSGFLTTNCDSQIIKKRIFRVLKPYVIWSLIYSILYQQINNFGYNLLSGQCCGIYYYILVYFQLTLLLPILFKCMNYKLWWTILLITPVGIAIEYALLAIGKPLMFPWNANNFVVWISFYYLGMCIRNKKINLEGIKIKYLLVYGCFAFLIQLSEMIYWFKLDNGTMAITQIKLSSMMFSVFVCLIFCKWIVGVNKGLKNKYIKSFFIILGDCSFGIYLTHILLMAVLERTLYRIIVFPFILKIIIIIIVSIVGITFVNRIIGKEKAKWLGFA